MDAAALQPGPRPAGKKVALFASCLVNYQVTDVGKATVQVLEKNGVQVALPDQSCCGMPSFDIGDTDGYGGGGTAEYQFAEILGRSGI